MEQAITIEEITHENGRKDWGVWLETERSGGYHVSELFISADTVEALHAELAALRAQVDALTAQRDALRAAVEPFAHDLDWYDSGNGYVMRRADRPIKREQTDALIIAYAQTAPERDADHA